MKSNEWLAGSCVRSRGMGVGSFQSRTSGPLWRIRGRVEDREQCVEVEEKAT